MPLLAVVIWTFLTPSLETLKTFSFGWAGLILLRNIGLAILVYGAWHVWLYVWRKQDLLSNTTGNGRKKSPRSFCSITRPTIICFIPS